MKRLVRTTVPLVALLGFTASVYWPGLNGPFILDDVPNLDVLRLLSEQGRLTLANVLSERGGFVGGRPLSWAFFLLNWHVAGADVWTFKLWNLLIHLVNGVLVLALAHRLLSAAEIADANARYWLALATCGFWLLTPIQVSCVLYVVQRMNLLAALFTLAGLLVYSLARTRYRSLPFHQVTLIGIAIGACWPLAALSKQNGILLLPLLLVVELLIFSPRSSERWPRWVLVGLCASMVGAGLVRIAIDPQWVLDTYALRDFTLEQRLLSQPRALLDYLLNIVQLPGGAALGLFHDDFAPSASLLTPPGTLPAILFWLSTLLLAWHWRRRPIGLIPTGGAFFLIAHSLEAGPFALELYFEHRNYLPSFGIWLALAGAAGLLLARNHCRRLVAALLAIVLAGHAALTAARVSDWRSFDGIVMANAATHPESRRARAGAAVVAFTGGELEVGLGHLRAVRELSGPQAELPVILKSLVGYCLSGHVPHAALVERLRSIRNIVADPYTVAALRWYRSVASERECPGLDTAGIARRLVDLAKRNLDQRRYGLHWSLYDELARIVGASGELTTARQFLGKAIAIAPGSRLPELQARLAAAADTSSPQD